jgi:hypothetical protein
MDQINPTLPLEAIDEILDTSMSVHSLNFLITAKITLPLADILTPI